jgi:hypothetical protein
MSGKAHAVLWMGLLLIFVRIFTTGQWYAIWGTLSDGTPVKLNGSSGNSTTNAAKTAFPGTGGKTGVTGDLLHGAEDIAKPAEGLNILKGALKLSGG